MPKTLKIDLHNHTFVSHDGFNRLSDFEKAHQKGKVDVVAITDHNTIDAALDFAKRANLPVIVGEEVETKDGDVIGLFLKETIPQGLSAQETISAIHDQKGLVYLPHPFDFFRVGLSKNLTLSLLPQIDFFEVINGAYSALFFRRYLKKVAQFAKKHSLLAAAGSDAHLPGDIGRSVVAVPAESLKTLKPQNLLEAVSQGTLLHKPSPFWLELVNLIFKRYPKSFYLKYLDGVSKRSRG